MIPKIIPPMMTLITSDIIVKMQTILPFSGMAAISNLPSFNDGRLLTLSQYRETLVRPRTSFLKKLGEICSRTMKVVAKTSAKEYSAPAPRIHVAFGSLNHYSIKFNMLIAASVAVTLLASTVTFRYRSCNASIFLRYKSRKSGFMVTSPCTFLVYLDIMKGSTIQRTKFLF